MLFSQIIPSSPSLSVSKSLFFVSPLLPCKQDHRYYLSRFHIYVLIYSICLSLTSLCIIDSRVIHLTRTDSNVHSKVIFHCVYVHHPPHKNGLKFSQQGNIPSCICTTTSLTIHASMDIEISSMSQESMSCMDSSMQE